MSTYSGVNKILLKLFSSYALGKLGVSLFVLITGYFMVNFKWSNNKLYRLYGPAIFYALLSLLLICLFFPSLLNGQIIISLLVPFLQGEWWWFLGSFTILLLCLPALLKLTINRPLKQEIIILLFLIFLYHIPTLPSYLGFISFFTICYVGYFLRKHWQFFNRPLIMIALFIITIFYLVVQEKVKSSVPRLKIFFTNSNDHNFFGMVLLGVLVFLLLCKINIKNSKLSEIILTTASCTWAVYLIGDGYIVRTFLRDKDIFNIGIVNGNGTLMVMKCLLIAISLFTLATLMELGRKKIICLIHRKLINPSS